MSNTPQAVGSTLSLSSRLSRASLDFPAAVAGSITVSGSLGIVVTPAPSYEKFLYGYLTPRGSLTKKCVKTFSGTLSIYSELLADRYFQNKGSLSIGSSLTLNVSKAVAGTISAAGNVYIYTGKHTDSASVTVSGALTKKISRSLSGSLACSGLGYSTRLLSSTMLLAVDIPELSFSGSVSRHLNKIINSTLSISGALEYPIFEPILQLAGTLTRVISKALGNTITSSGDLSPSNRMYSVNLSSQVELMKVLTVGVVLHTYSDASPLNLAAKDNITIEQGSSFAKYYRWMKDDGIPFDLARFNLKMAITPIKGENTKIAVSPTDITITKSSTDPGVFLVEMTDDVTMQMNFTRATYEITATWQTYRVRLVEGEVTLNRGRFIDYAKAPAGSFTVAGAVSYTKHSSASASGSITASGSVTPRVTKFTLSGTLTTSGGVTTA